MLKKRILSAFVAIGIGAPIIIFLGSHALYAFTLLIAAGCLYEYFSITIGGDSAKEIRLVGTTLGLFLLALNIYVPESFASLSTVLVLTYCLYFLFRAKKFKKTIAPQDGYPVGKYLMDMSISLFGIFFITMLLRHLPMLRDMPNGLKWIVLLMAVIWLGDTGAYFVGKKFGKTKLYPEVSPKKSIEGSMGGLLFSVLAAIACKIIFFWDIDFIDCFILGVVGGALGQLGDLFESLVKRSALVKDSGAIMPGHGGIFDRFDAMIFAVPFFYFYSKYFF